MRRVTIEEAAKCLDVTEEVVKTRIKTGQLVACQDPAFRGYVWLNEPLEQAPKRKSRSKSRAGGPLQETPAPAPTRRSSSKSRASAPAEETPAPATKRKPQGKSQETVPQEEAAEPVSPRQSGSLLHEGESHGLHHRGQTGEGAQEVQLLQETVAMLKEELANRDKQLAMKDAEIEARRAEFRELLAILQQNPALPAAPSTGTEELPDSIAGNLRTAYALFMDRVAHAVDIMLSHLSQLVSRIKGKTRSLTRRGQEDSTQHSAQDLGAPLNGHDTSLNPQQNGKEQATNGVHTSGEGHSS